MLLVTTRSHRGTRANAVSAATVAVAPNNAEPVPAQIEAGSVDVGLAREVRSKIGGLAFGGVRRGADDADIGEALDLVYLVRPRPSAVVSGVGNR
jgi:hypothetical protein